MNETSSKIFAPADVPETNATTIPEPFKATNQLRYNRRLGDFAGLQNFGVNQTRLPPGAQSSYRHAHSRQDEFVYVLDGEIVVETNAGAQTISAGMCAGFPAGTSDAHRFVNQSSRDVVLLVIGDRSAGDVLTYPEIDLHGTMDSDGRYRYSRKDGTPL